MKKRKIVYLNYDLDCSVGYIGNIFSDWMAECDEIDKVEINKQYNVTELFNKIEDIAPEMIIINDSFDNLIISAIEYKAVKPSTKLILIFHGGQINDIIYKYFDLIIIINYNFKFSSDNIRIFYIPTDPSIYKIMIPWNMRKKELLYLGSLAPHKFSEEFIEKNKFYIDCYGGFPIQVDDKYRKLVLSNKYILYKNKVPLNMVSSIFNEYKYYVLPHNGWEPFNWSLLQAIFCGCIPLVVNDRDSTSFDTSWIDWAEGLYFGCNKVDDFLINIEELLKENPDYTNLSEQISKFVNLKFDYNAFKNEFINLILGG